jgi:hypothetical protein
VKLAFLAAASGLALMTASPACAQHEEPDGQMPPMDMAAMPAMDHGMRGALGAYPMAREASGTAWLVVGRVKIEASRSNGREGWLSSG